MAVRLKREWFLLFGAVGLAVGAVLAGITYGYLAGPNRLSLAVGPRDGVEARLMEAYARVLDQQKMDVRLRVKSFASVRQSAEALSDQKFDMGIVRPDVFLPDNGLTVAILREEAAIIVAPTATKIKDMKDLERKRLGLVTRHEADPHFIDMLLAYYDLSPPKVTIVPLGPEEVEAAVTAKKVDAVAFVAVPTGPGASGLLKGIERATGGKITFVPVTEAEALSQKMPVLTPVTIPEGAFGGRPTQPDGEVKTIGVSYRLMARQNLDRVTVSEATQYLFEMRARLAKAIPAANLMKAPDSDDSTSAALPNHRGAIDYFEREQLTFMDRYGDWMYLLLTIGGGGGSALAWVAQRFARKRREMVDDVLDRLVAILAEARAAATVAALDELALEIDKLVVAAVQHARDRATGTRTMSALILAIDSARAAIADRRREVIDTAAAAEPPRGTIRLTAAS